ncbi:MAG: hypothetical protein ACLP9L_03420 [Thermoguttaceae bacterium]
MAPLPEFVATGLPDAAEPERLLIGVANASAASSEDRDALVGIIRRAFEKRTAERLPTACLRPPYPLPQPG